MTQPPPELPNPLSGPHGFLEPCCQLGHLLDSSIPLITDCTWAPHPPHVALPQLQHFSFQHMIVDYYLYFDSYCSSLDLSAYTLLLSRFCCYRIYCIIFTSSIDPTAIHSGEKAHCQLLRGNKKDRPNLKFKKRFRDRTRSSESDAHLLIPPRGAHSWHPPRFIHPSPTINIHQEKDRPITIKKK